jgi:hypothetical protein
MKKLEGKKQHFEAKVAKIPLCYVNLTCGARPNVSLLNLTLSFFFYIQSVAFLPSSFKKISHSVTSKFHVGEKLGMPPAITLTTKIKLALIFSKT